MFVYFLSKAFVRKTKLTQPIFYTLVALVIIIIITFYVRHQQPPSRTIHKNDPIEDALLNISTCTTNDRARQRALLVTLQAWADLAHKFHIQYWIAYGTLVGYVQRRGLLSHDLDLDILMMVQDTAQLAALSMNISNQTVPWFDVKLYKLVVHPQWFIIGMENRSYYPSRGIHFVAPNARFINRRERRHVDIYPIYDYHPSLSEDPNKKIPMLTEYDVDYNWKSNPRMWTFPLRPCNFSGVRVLCPAEPDEIVTTLYGKTALYKSDRACVNGSWVYQQLEPIQ